MDKNNKNSSILGLTKTMSCGLNATVIDYINSHNMTVLFEDGLIRHKIRKDGFMRGYVPHIIETSTETEQISAFETKAEIRKRKHIGTKAKMKNGLYATIIDYKNSRNMTVRFENGIIRENISISHFNAGHVGLPENKPKIIEDHAEATKKTREQIIEECIEKCKEKYIGMTNKMHCGLNATITDYKNYNNITIVFENGVVRENVNINSFKKGRVGLINTGNKIGTTKMMNCGMKATIINSRKVTLLTIKFEDGTIRNNIEPYRFYKGNVEVIDNDEMYEPTQKKYVGMTKTMKCGMIATIIEYTNNKNITIKFENGTVRKNITVNSFLTGNADESSGTPADNNIDKEHKQFIGISKKMNCGLTATIINYTNARDIDVAFEDGHIISHVTRNQFLDGDIIYSSKIPYANPNPSDAEANLYDIIKQQIASILKISPDATLTNLGVPFRICNILEKQNITTVKQVQNLDDDELGRIPKMTNRDVKKLRAILSGQMTVEINGDWKFTPELFAETLTCDINKYCKNAISIQQIYDVINENINLFDTSKTLDYFMTNETIMSKLYHNEILKLTAKSIIQYVITNVCNNCSQETLNKYLPKSLIASNELNNCLNDLINDKTIDFYCGKYSIMQESLRDYVSKLQSNKRIPVVMRLSGQSYDDIAKWQGKTRQNAHNTVASVLRRHIRVFENRYKYWYMTYNIGKDLFCKLFETDDFTYNYLKETCYKGQGSLNDLINDPHLTNKQKDLIQSNK